LSQLVRSGAAVLFAPVSGNQDVDAYER